eukprot:scaffold225470_cov64-Attheya_sp.AAC.5
MAMRGKTVQSLWKEGDGRLEPVLQELLGLPGRLSDMPGILVHFWVNKVEDDKGHQWKRRKRMSIIAAQMVLALRQKGKNNPVYTQFDTVWRYKTSFSNQWCALATGSFVILSMGSPDGKDHIQFSACPTNSLWFTCFFEGCQLMTGQDVRQNLSLEDAVVKALLDLVEQELDDDPDEEELRWVVTVGTYIAVMYATLLQGNEGFMLDLHTLRKWFLEGKDEELSYIILPLLECFKEKKARGSIYSHSFLHAFGSYVVSSREVDAKFRDLVTTLQSRRPAFIGSETDVGAEISIGRSLRWGTQSISYGHNNVSSKRSDQDMVNMWRSQWPYES